MVAVMIRRWLACRRLAKSLKPRPKSALHIIGWRTRRANDFKRRAKVIAKAIELAEQNGRPDLVQRLRGA